MFGFPLPIGPLIIIVKSNNCKIFKHSVAARPRYLFEVLTCLSGFDELYNVPQGTYFHIKKSGFQLPGVFQRTRGPYHGQKRLVEVVSLQSKNLVDLRL